MSFDVPFELPDGWEIKMIEELVKEKVIEKPLDGNHGGTHPKSADYVSEGIPFVMASDLEAGRVNFSRCKFITEKQASKLRKGFAKAGDILISHKATIGRTAIVQENDYPFIMLTPQVTYYRVTDKEKLSNIYLKAYLDSPFFQSLLALWAGAGSTRAYLGITGQLKLPVIIPPADKQDFIASQVLAINEKIELNTQINQTLEAIAQALFKSWFVDFDPVKAKIAALAKLPSPFGRGVGGEGSQSKHKLPANLLENARKLRQTATDAEKLLWQLLRNRQIDNSKFRRQHPIGSYILDFYCHECQLAIELDGGQHNEAQQKQYDEQRTAYLNEQGIQVLRFWNNEVFQQTEAVLEAIYRAVVERKEPSPLAPLPEGEGDKDHAAEPSLPSPFGRGVGGEGEHPSVTMAAMEVISGKTTEQLVELKQSKSEDYEQLAQIAALFPSAMQESELGEIPEGWKVSTIEESFKVVMGQSPKGDTYNENEKGTLFYQRRAEFGWRFPSPRLYTTDPKRMASKGDILMSVRAPVGDLNIALNDCCVGRGLCSFIHNSNNTTFTYYLLKHLQTKFDMFNGEGTVFGSINQKDLKSITFVSPTENLINTFISMTKCIDEEIESLSLELNTLSELRDTLLPKLLSGEITPDSPHPNPLPEGEGVEGASPLPLGEDLGEGMEAGL